MAVHPLRPATHRRLGGPLPRQLANGPRTHLSAIPQDLSCIPHVKDASHPVLSHVSMCYPGLRGRLSTCYSPVRRSGVPKDLTARLACLKRAASVRSEPGSNSPLSETREQVPVHHFLITLVHPVILARTGILLHFFFNLPFGFRIDRSLRLPFLSLSFQSLMSFKKPACFSARF